VSPPRAGLTLSVLLRPDVPQEQWPWVPLLAGLAVSVALREQAEVEALLKWPNDVLVGDRKVCGVLAEVAGDAVVLGIGLNVSTRRDELPHDGATSLLLESASTTDRGTLLKAVLRGLSLVQRQPGAAREAYRQQCSTVGRRVRVELPAREPVEGTAEAVDDAGRLVVDGVAYGAGDVVHVRPGSPRDGHRLGVDEGLAAVLRAALEGLEHVVAGRDVDGRRPLAARRRTLAGGAEAVGDDLAVLQPLPVHGRLEHCGDAAELPAGRHGAALARGEHPDRRQHLACGARERVRRCRRRPRGCRAARPRRAAARARRRCRPAVTVWTSCWTLALSKALPAEPPAAASDRSTVAVSPSTSTPRTSVPAGHSDV
jgi:BirA family biotin operon repressor/biotin-[acetyl-CoA-carboxylase] ligase